MKPLWNEAARPKILHSAVVEIAYSLKHYLWFYELLQRLFLNKSGIMHTHLFQQAGSANWFSKLVQQAGSANWFSKLVQQAGSASWFSKLVQQSTYKQLCQLDGKMYVTP